jgi:hypothetical protein
MMRALLFVALLQAAAASVWGCIFDCHLYGGFKGSARGYVEFECAANTTAACCSWSQCVDAANALYKGSICPTNSSLFNSPSFGDDGAAKYQVGTWSAAHLDGAFPRNQHKCPNLACTQPSGTTVNTCSTVSTGCVGNCALPRFS